MARNTLKGTYKATPATIKTILMAIEEGLTQKDAATLAGIDQDTLINWKKNSDFSDQVRQAEISFKRKHLKLIDEAAKTDTRNSKWLLERKFPGEFASYQKSDVNVTTEDDVLKQLLAKISAMLPN